MVLVGHRRDRRHLGDQADRGDHALVRIGDVGRVVIEGRQRADHAAHDRHRMRVAAEAGEEARHLLVHHGVARDAIVEVVLLGLGRQFAVEQQVADFEEVAVLGQLVDRIAAMQQHALVAIDKGDLRLAARGRGEARIVGEGAGFLVERADVDDLWADRATSHLNSWVLPPNSSLAVEFGHRKLPLFYSANGDRPRDNAVFRHSKCGFLLTHFRGRAKFGNGAYVAPQQACCNANQRCHCNVNRFDRRCAPGFLRGRARPARRTRPARCFARSARRAAAARRRRA